MATLLISPPRRLQRPPTFPIFPTKPSSQRLPIPRISAVNGSSTAQHMAANDWPFKRRMQEALHVLNLMESQGIKPDASLFCIILQSCADSENLEFGTRIHAKIRESKLENDLFVANNLINMYVKCGCLRSARKAFDEMPMRNVVSWTSIISGYSQKGLPQEALKLYELMKSSEVRPNVFTYATVLNACAKTCNVNRGIEIHEDIAKDGCESDGFIVTALIDMYAKCGRPNDARRVLDTLDEPAAEAVTAMIEGYNANGQGKEAMELIRRILQSESGMKIVRELGFTCMIRSCITQVALKQGQEIHCHMIKSGHKPGARTIIALVVLYEKCNKVGIARQLFDELLEKDVGLWSRMTSGYVRNGFYQDALELYCKMVSEDVNPNLPILSRVLSACVGLSGLGEGKQIHCRAIKTGYELSEVPLIGNLVKLYSQCGEVEQAQKLMKSHRKQSGQHHQSMGKL